MSDEGEEFRDDSVYGSEQSEGGKSDDEVKGSEAKCDHRAVVPSGGVKWSSGVASRGVAHCSSSSAADSGAGSPSEGERELGEISDLEWLKRYHDADPGHLIRDLEEEGRAVFHL